MARTPRHMTALDGLALSGNAGMEAHLKSERLHDLSGSSAWSEPSLPAPSFRQRLGSLLIAAGCLIGGTSIGTRSAEGYPTGALHSAQP